MLVLNAIAPVMDLMGPAPEPMLHYCIADVIFWVFVGLSLLMTTASFLLMPQSREGSGPDPATLEDFTRATADQDRVVPEVFGLCEIKPNLLYYGQLRTYKRKKHGSTIGHAYFMDMIWGIARGIDELRQFRMNDRVMIDLEGLVDVTLTDATFDPATNYLSETGAFAGLESWELEGKRISVFNSETNPTLGGVYTINQKIDDNTVELTSLILDDDEPLSGLQGSKWKILVRTGPSAPDGARPTQSYRSVIEWTDGTQTALPAYWRSHPEVDPDVAYKGVALILMRNAFIGDDVRSIPNYSVVAKNCSRTLNSRVIDVALTGGSWNHATKKLTQASAFARYTWASGDRILITGDGSGNVGIQSLEIAGKDSDDRIELVTNALDASSDRAGVTSVGNPSDIEGDANAADILYRIYTQMAKVPVSYMAISAWEVVAQRLKAEGMGISVPMNRAKTVEEWEKEILRHIDGYVYFDDASGKFTIQLQRELTAAEQAALPLFTNADFRDLQIKRGAWESVHSDLICKGTSRRTFKMYSYHLVNPATRLIMDYRKSQTVSFPFASRSAVLAELIRRCERRYFYPYAVLTFSVSQALLDSLGAPLNPGDAFKFSDSGLGFSNAIFRVMSIAKGDTTRRNEVEVEAVEDNIKYLDLAEIPIPEQDLLPSEELLEPVAYPLISEAPPALANQAGDGSSYLSVCSEPSVSQATALYQVLSSRWTWRGGMAISEEWEAVESLPYARGTGTLKDDLPASVALVDEILIENPVGFETIDNSGSPEARAAWQQGEVLLLVCDYRQRKSLGTDIEGLTWTASTKRLSKILAFSGYTWTSGDRCRVLQDDSGTITERWVTITAKVNNSTIEIDTEIDASNRTGVQIRSEYKHGGIYYELMAPRKLEQSGAYWKASRVLRGVAGAGPYAWKGGGTPSRTARVYCLPALAETSKDLLFELIDQMGANLGDESVWKIETLKEDEEDSGPTSILRHVRRAWADSPLPPENVRCWRFDDLDDAKDFAAGDKTKPLASVHGEYLLIAYSPHKRKGGATVVNCDVISPTAEDYESSEYLQIDAITSGVSLFRRDRGWFHEDDAEGVSIRTARYEIHRLLTKAVHTFTFFVSTKIGIYSSKVIRKPAILSSTY